jgi:GNAT superfamily N-acetyltransferase
MPRLEIRAFSEEHLDDAARLLGERHARHREAEPLLPEHVDFRAEIEALLAAGAVGAVGVRDRRVVAYLLGTRLDKEAWGPNVWVELAAHAAEQAEDIRDLYGFAAGPWVEEGRTRHYALVPATDAPLVDAWFRLGFGHQQAQAIRAVPPETEVRAPEGFEIRKPTAADVEALIEVDLALPRHQRLSPVFSERPMPSADEIREEWASILAGSDEEVFVAYRDGRPVACWGVAPAEVSRHHRGLSRPERACYLAFASTLPESRGSGIGVALTDAALAWASEQRYAVMVTDWRVPNLLASRFWPRRGFRETFLRLYRHIP